MTTSALPRSLDDLRGLRAARYRRESSEEQATKYGPLEQDHEIDDFIERLGMVDTGIVFADKHSAWHRSEARPEFLAMTEAAAEGRFDVLVIAYFSRFSRSVEQAIDAKRLLHRTGVPIAFADERFLSSDEDKWEDFIDEAVSAEKFSRRLSRRIRKTLHAKFERHADQAGSPGLGFVRTPQPEARLAIEPVAMARVVALFERYAAGDISYAALAAEHDMAEGRLRAILGNPIYNGWIVRHRGRHDEERREAPWRTSPPVCDELWARVVEARSRRAKTSGRQHPVRPHLLSKVLWCSCGRAVRAETTKDRRGNERRRYRHDGCELWSRRTRTAETFDAPVRAQLEQLRLDARTVERLRSRAGQPVPPDTELRRRQLERELRRKAEAHAARSVTTEAYLAEHERISAEIDGLDAVRPVDVVADPDRIEAFLRELRDAWRAGGEEARQQLVRAVYERIVVTGDGIVEAKLTPEAWRHGLAQALPETVEVALARPARAKRAKATSVRIPIVGRRDWLKLARSA